MYKEVVDLKLHQHHVEMERVGITVYRGLDWTGLDWMRCDAMHEMQEGWRRGKRRGGEGREKSVILGGGGCVRGGWEWLRCMVEEGLGGWETWATPIESP